jgi:polar amino acid transport system substrate-binding protein
MKRLLTFWLYVLYVLLPQGTHAETISVYTSANFAPLMIEGQRGIYYDMVEYLNQQQLGKTRFQLVYLPRKRLQMRLEDGSLDGIVIGMMPAWFDDVAQKKYLWTPPFSVDRFVLVSRQEKPVLADAGGSQYGKTIGLTLGYVYPGIDEWIRSQGLLRQDAISEEVNLEKLRLGRLDCVAVSESVARYYMRLHSSTDRFVLLDLPGRATERRFLIPHVRNDVYDKIAPIIRKLREDPAWQRAISKYE